MINNPLTLEQNLLIQTWEKDITMQSIPTDVFSFSSADTVYSTEKRIPLPDAIKMNLKSSALGSREVTVPLLLPLRGDPTYGVTGDQRSREENARTRSATFQYNDVSHAMPGQAYGMLSIDKLSYELFDLIGPQLSIYFKEMKGLHCRQAYLEGVSENVYADTHNLTPEICTNAYIGGLAFNQQPNYTGAPGSWANALGTQMQNAGTGQGASCTVRFLQNLERFVSTGKCNIQPLNVGGRETYVTLIPDNQAVWLKDAQNAGQLGNIFINKSGLTKEEMGFPGVLGRVGRLLLIEDNRAPTLSIGGSAGSWTLTPGYYRMGDNDERDHSADARDVVAVFGKSAICEWMPENLHFEYERDQYGKIYGKGLFGSWGIKRVEYDASENRTANTRVNFGCAIGVVAKPPALV